MTFPERAAQIWPVLALAARHRQTLTYDLLSKLTGMMTPGLGKCLEPIQSYCLARGLPPLTVLVVSGKDGLPGVGFTGTQQSLPVAQEQVYSYDWIEHRCPTPEVFADVLRS